MIIVFDISPSPVYIYIYIIYVSALKRLIASKIKKIVYIIYVYCYIYYVYINKHTCMYIFQKNMLCFILDILYII